MVVEAGMTELERGQLLTEEAYLDAIEKHGDEFTALMGAEAIQHLLKTIDARRGDREAPRGAGEDRVGSQDQEAPSA